MRNRKPREDYKQFMFHFHGYDSIDGRDVSEKELKFLLGEYSLGQKYPAPKYPPRYNYGIALKLLKLWLPEYLV